MSDTKPTDGGPAYPTNCEDWRDIPNHPSPGMTLRDYFAGQAVQAVIFGCMTNNDACDALLANAKAAGQKPEQQMASRAYTVADAMLAEREGGER